eukprot:487699-Amphidinium_carterae.1
MAKMTGKAGDFSGFGNQSTRLRVSASISMRTQRAAGMPRSQGLSIFLKGAMNCDKQTTSEFIFSAAFDVAVYLRFAFGPLWGGSFLRSVLRRQGPTYRTLRLWAINFRMSRLRVSTSSRETTVPSTSGTQLAARGKVMTIAIR